MTSDLVRRSIVVLTLVAVAGGGACARRDRPNAQMQAVLDEFSALGGKPIESLTPAEARQQPSPAEAVKSLLKKQGKSTEPEPVADVHDEKVGEVPIRIYKPDGAAPFPVIFYIHGGGWVIGTLDTYDSSARALANAARAIVVSTHYHQAPEQKFPASHEDAYVSYQWTALNIHTYGGDPSRMAVAGESAGGNMALDVALKAKVADRIAPVALLLIYPIAGTATDTASYKQYADAKPLNRAMMMWFFQQELEKPAEATDVRLNAVSGAPERYRGLPPTTIVLAEIDPLRSEGEALGDKLRSAKVETVTRTFRGVTHEFFGMGAAVDEARSAVGFAAQTISAYFGQQSQ